MGEGKEPISAEERHAFNSALAVFGDWKYGDPKEPEPKATYQRQPASIDLICDIVEKRAGQMPPTEHLTLCDMAMRLLPGEGMPEDNFYTSGAKCLRRLLLRARQRQEMQRKSDEQ